MKKLQKDEKEELEELERILSRKNATAKIQNKNPNKKQ